MDVWSVKGGVNLLCEMKTEPNRRQSGFVLKCFHLGGVLFEHADGFGVDGGGLGLQVSDGAVGLDGEDGVGLGHVHRVLDVGGAAVLQLHLLQAALVVSLCREDE